MKPYWDATAARFCGAERGAVEGKFDVAIVGGGFTGLSCALALARKGASAVILEAGRVVGEASGRNGGHVNNGLGGSYRAARCALGVEKAQQLYHAYDSGVDLIERLVSEENIDCGFKRTGKLKLAYKLQHFDALQAEYDVMIREVDPDLTLIPRSSIRSEVDSDAFHGALLYQKSGQMHMGAFGAGLATAAARRGARIYENANVTRFDRTAKGYKIETGKGTVEAKQLLLATGTSRKWPFGWLRQRIIPVGSFIVATEPLPVDILDRILPNRRNGVTTKNIGNYFGIMRDNRLLFGGRARFTISSPISDAKSGEILQAKMREVFPFLKGTRIDYCWGGLLDMTINRLPRAGERDGVFYSMGYSGHGTQMSIYIWGTRWPTS
jgi:glycine/D-amino acid oxidase-like deaminating enzyme